MNKKIIGIFLFLIFAMNMMVAQVIPISRAEISAKLKEKGITEQELEERLQANGVNVRNVDPTNPAEVAKVKQDIEFAIAQLEAEKTKGVPPASNSNADSVMIDKPKEVGEENQTIISDAEQDKVIEENQAEIQKSISEGATVEEAVAEEVAEELEEKLPPAKTWGQQVFRDKKISIYQQSRDTKPPASYVLGPGDRVAVSIWGYSQENVVFEINEDGYIKPERMPRIYLKGISLGKAKKLIESRFSQFYRFRSEEFEVTLNFARTITVNVVGEVFNYGSFTLPARNTAFNALAATGGPTDLGSVRNIQLIRAQQEPIDIDIYRFLLNPSAEDNLFLQENDYIYVPMVERVVEIEGAVRRPFKYELVEGENLKQLIDFAAGLELNAYTDNVEIIRTISGRQTYLNANLTAILNGDSDFQLKDGDIITIPEIAVPFENFVEISGTVEVSGKFELTPNMKILDLVNKGGLLKEARRDVAYLERSNDDGTKVLKKIPFAEVLENPISENNLELEPGDKLTIYSLPDITDTYTISVDGAVRNPRSFPYDANQNFRVEDMITLSGGFKRDAREYGYIQRTNIDNVKKVSYVRVNVKNAVSNPDSPDNLILQPTDKLFVYGEESITESFNVSVAGAVRNGGSYPYEPGLNLSDVLFFSNGFTLGATDFGYIVRTDPINPDNQEYIRVNVRNAFENPGSVDDIALAPLDKLQVFTKEAYTDQFTISVEGQVRMPGTFDAGEGLTLRDALTLSDGLKLEAASSKVEIYRMNLDEENGTRTTVATFGVDENFNIISGGTGEFFLEPFDKVIVREIPDFETMKTVTLEGEVRYAGTYPIINKNERLSSLINRSGGLSLEAFPEGATLVRVEDGQEGNVILKLDKALKNKSSRYNFILKPDDVIVIPKQKDLVTLEIENSNISEIIDSTILESDQINVAYNGRKRAKYYVNKYMGGVDRKKGRKSRVTVRQPNGRFEKAKHFGLFIKYPKVEKGAVVSIGAKPEKKEKEEGIFKEDKEKIDWGAFIRDSITTATATVSLILLIRELRTQ